MLLCWMPLRLVGPRAKRTFKDSRLGGRSEWKNTSGQSLSRVIVVFATDEYGAFSSSFGGGAPRDRQLRFCVKAVSQSRFAATRVERMIN